MEAISVSKARSELSDLINRVNYGKERFIVQRHGKDAAAIVPMEEYRLLEEYIEELEDAIDNATSDTALEEAKKLGTIPLERIRREFRLP